MPEANIWTQVISLIIFNNLTIQIQILVKSITIGSEKNISIFGS